MKLGHRQEYLEFHQYPGKRDNVKEDTYVAVMGGGLSLNDPCAGSAVFLVNLEDRDNPGSIFGAEENGGPISIVDTDPGGLLWVMM